MATKIEQGEQMPTHLMTKTTQERLEKQLEELEKKLAEDFKKRFPNQGEYVGVIE